MLRKKKHRDDFRFVVKTERPEDKYSPEQFYSTPDGVHYATTSGMKRVQVLIARRIDELLEMETPAKILDLGIGAGFAAAYFENQGFEVHGLDVSEELAKISREKGFNVKSGSMCELKKHFQEGEFDYVVSVSALQWLRGDEDDLKKVAKGIYHVLKPGGKAGIQFYPKDDYELSAVKKAFYKYFDGGVMIDNPNNPRKRRIYLVLTSNK